MAKAKGGKNAAPTPLGDDAASQGYFLGPLYTKPAKTAGYTNLGAEPVEGPTKGPSVHDPLGYTSFPKANVGAGKKGKKKGY